MTDAITQLLGQARESLRLGKVGDAYEVYQQTLALDPLQGEALFHCAMIARQAGNLQEALDYLQRAVSTTPAQPQYSFSLGIVLDDLGRRDEAMASLREAIRFKPEYAEAHNNLGILLHDQGKLNEAIASFREAVRINPGYARAYNNLGNSLRATGYYDEAENCFREAVRLKPDYMLAYYNLGIVQMDQGKLADAEANFRYAIQLKPDYPSAFGHLGHVLRLQGKLDLAETSFREAARLRPENNAADYNNLGYVYWEQGKHAQAVAAYRQVLSKQPHDLKALLGASLSLPAIYRNRTEIASMREQFARGIEVLQGRLPDIADNNVPAKLLDDLRWSNFYLAYQGMDDKALQAVYGEFVSNLLNRAAPEYMGKLAKPECDGRRIRIGYLSNFLTDCTVGMYFKSWVTRIDKNEFEVFFYHIRPETDFVTQQIASACDHFRHLAGGATTTASIAHAVQGDRLDILVYPELGMDATTFLLAAMRLAPVQCAAWGHPVTSGHSNIDYFLSSEPMEPEHSGAHYSETLVTIKGIGTCYPKPFLPSPGKRADFSLPEDRTLYLCPQSLFKIHPDNDELFVRVAEADPNAVLVFFSGRHPAITQSFLQRLTGVFHAHGLDHQGRGVVLPYMGHDDYLRVNMLCDVMLDTLHWSGGNTSLDALACGLPIVTLPGEFMRGRQSYGMLKTMGVEELIAQDQDDYVRIAVQMGVDGVKRHQMAERIVANRGKIFEREDPLRDLEQFYLSCVKR